MSLKSPGIYLTWRHLCRCGSFRTNAPESACLWSQQFLPEKEGTRADCTSALPICIRESRQWVHDDEKGHYHANVDRAEFYWGLGGRRYADSDGRAAMWAEHVFPGSLHYIPGSSPSDGKYGSSLSHLLPVGLRTPGIIMPRLQKTDSLPDWWKWMVSSFNLTGNVLCQ